MNLLDELSEENQEKMPSFTYDPVKHIAHIIYKEDFGFDSAVKGREIRLEETITRLNYGKEKIIRLSSRPQPSNYFYQLINYPQHVLEVAQKIYATLTNKSFADTYVFFCQSREDLGNLLFLHDIKQQEPIIVRETTPGTFVITAPLEVLLENKTKLESRLKKETEDLQQNRRTTLFKILRETPFPCLHVFVTENASASYLELNDRYLELVPQLQKEIDEQRTNEYEQFRLASYAGLYNDLFRDGKKFATVQEVQTALQNLIETLFTNQTIRLPVKDWAEFRKGDLFTAEYDRPVLRFFKRHTRLKGMFLEHIPGTLHYYPPYDSPSKTHPIPDARNLTLQRTLDFAVLFTEADKYLDNFALQNMRDLSQHRIHRTVYQFTHEFFAILDKGIRALAKEKFCTNYRLFEHAWLRHPSSHKDNMFTEVDRQISARNTFETINDIRTKLNTLERRLTGKPVYHGGVSF